MTNDGLPDDFEMPKSKADDDITGQRTTWLSMLRDSLSLIGEDELIEPDGEYDESRETLLGVMHMEDRKMFTYAEQLEEQASRMIVDARFAKQRENNDEREELARHSYELTLKSGLVRDMMWANLKDQFKVWSPHLYIGLRKGFLVVSGRRQR